MSAYSSFLFLFFSQTNEAAEEREREGRRGRLPRLLAAFVQCEGHRRVFLCVSKTEGPLQSQRGE